MSLQLELEFLNNRCYYNLASYYVSRNCCFTYKLQASVHGTYIVER